jgi:hypothetical protein
MKLKVFSMLFAILLALQAAQETRAQITKKTFPTQKLEWQFPISRPLAGPLLGNGNIGIMVWGDSTLNITFALAGFWDHRGGKDFPPDLTFSQLKHWLQNGLYDSLGNAFGKNEGLRPQQLGGGRLVFKLPPRHKLERAVLNLAEGEIEVWIKTTLRDEKLTIRIDRTKNLVYVLRPFYEPKDKIRVSLQAMGDLAKDAWQSRSLPAPLHWKDGNAMGFWQALPEDQGLAAACEQKGKAIFLSASLQTQLNKSQLTATWAKFNELTEPIKNKRWWAEYWKTVPAFWLPDLVVQEIGEFGLYKMACMAATDAPPITLQGPFMEDHKLAPWSNDYHFNVNVQMTYEPFSASNLSHLQQPLWNFLKTQIPHMERNGRQFFGRPSWLLPHAIDDRGKIPSSFWTGTIDQGCGAWMALLAWRHYLYNGDQEQLRQFAYPFMVNVLQGYRAMLERDPDKFTFMFMLPVSVSPEFKGASADAWGKNASYQLAAARALALAIIQADKVLNQPINSLADSIVQFLPAYTSITAAKTLEYPQHNSKRIALWENLDLVESHRHHSHLAGIYPFRSVAWEDSANKAIITNSLYHWSRKGYGAWTGWSVPWAASLLAKTDQPDAAVSLLHWWNFNFTNEGRGTLHDIAFPLANTTATANWNNVPAAINKEKIQFEAGFGALQAVYDLLIRNTNSGLYLLPAIPSRWQNLEFDGLHTEGGFIVGAKVKAGRVVQISIKSKRSETLRLHLPFKKYLVNGRVKTGYLLHSNLGIGEVLVIEPVER